MTGKPDDKLGQAAPRPLLVNGLPGAVAPVKSATQPGDVTEEVARVVDLLQRLDRMHSAPAGTASPPAAMPTNAKPPPPRPDGLSSLSALRDRGASRGAPAAVPYLVPPVAPAVDPSLPPPANAPDLRLNSRDSIARTSATAATEAFPSVLAKPEAGPSAPEAIKGAAKDRAPIALIGSVIAVVAGFAGWGLYNLQPGAPVAKPAGLTADWDSVAPAQARLDAGVVRAAPPKADKPEGVLLPGCGHVAVTADPATMELAVTDPARAGQTVDVAVGGLTFKATFEASGRLRIKAPLLSQTSNIRWAGTNGAACEQTATGTHGGALLRIALAWTGESALDLHAIEPNSWFGGPTGHVSNLAPNSDHTHGAGMIETYGAPGGTRVLVYSVDPVRIPPGGVINAFVKPVPGEPTSPCTGNGNPIPTAPIQYQVHILRSGSGNAWQQDVQTFALQRSPCGTGSSAPATGERIMVRN